MRKRGMYMSRAISLKGRSISGKGGNILGKGKTHVRKREI